MKLFIIALLLWPALTNAATLDLKLSQPINGYEQHFSLSDTVESIRLKADYAYGEVKDIVTVDKGSLSVHYDKPVNSKWEVWFFDIAEYNNLYNTRDNYLGAGPKYYILDGDHILTFSTGVLYDYDHISGTGRGRYSHRPKYAYKDWASAVYFYQPTIEDSTDYIEKYKLTAVLPYTNRAGEIYCQKEYRSKIGTIDSECGLMASIKFGGD